MKIAAILGVGALLLAGGSALGAFSAGAYRGVTESKKPVSFKVAKRKVTDFRIRVRYGCTDYDTFWTTDDGFPAMRIRRGRFTGGFGTSDGTFRATIRGTLDRRTAKGSYAAERRYDREGNLDARGRVTCHVTKTLWRAKRR